MTLTAILNSFERPWLLPLLIIPAVLLAWIWRGPWRVPERFEAPMSIGTPTKHTSSPSAVACVGRRIMVAGPAKRAISLPPSGWLKLRSVIHITPEA